MTSCASQRASRDTQRCTRPSRTTTWVDWRSRSARRSTSATPSKVKVTGVVGLRDWRSEFEDPYSGLIEVAVMADLAHVKSPSPGDARGDLVIVGAEVTQAIQHFRSADHLDGSNIFPNNSIRLIAGKPTAVRLYVDYDASSGLPLINWLTSSLSLNGSSGTRGRPADRVE